MLRDGKKEKEIAERIGVDVSTIYREKKRGQYEHLNSDYTTEIRYSPDIAHKKYRENLKAKGPALKIRDDHELANYIEKKIGTDGYSPEAVLGEIKRDGIKFKTMISKTTLYRYIDMGLFLTITNKELPVKGRKKKKNKKVRTQSRANAGDSIEKRPKEIDDRKEFGHWEMDTVVGKRGESKNSLLVLTERKTRKEIIVKLAEHTMEQVCSALDSLEEKWGSYFSRVFKTITVDNGSEFSDCAGMEKSSINDSNRTKVYYCHPYSSYERGSNENQNRLVRRKIPKGTNFDARTAEEIQEVEDWINNYPRGMFGYESAQMRFDMEISAIGA
ncbi:MAG: IS30 family transposase [Clostridiales bacterium]|nr:IS30 family transposase [Clostridiales bacterium]